MTENREEKKGEKAGVDKEKRDKDEVLEWKYAIEDEMYRWMTEGTNPNNVPNGNQS